MRLDRYACEISPEGFCVFTGTPHPNGLKPGTEDIVDRDGKVLFQIDGAVAANSSGAVLKARGTPAFDGDLLIQSSQNGMSDYEKAFHRVMVIMFPIRNALMHDIADLSRIEWDILVAGLEKRKIKETTFTEGATPRDYFNGRQGIFKFAKKLRGRDIHHAVMKFLEESGLYFLCHVTSATFNQMLNDTHPEGDDACGNAGIKKNQISSNEI